MSYMKIYKFYKGFGGRAETIPPKLTVNWVEGEGGVKKWPKISDKLKICKLSRRIEIGIKSVAF